MLFRLTVELHVLLHLPLKNSIKVTQSVVWLMNGLIWLTSQGGLEKSLSVRTGQVDFLSVGKLLFIPFAQWPGHQWNCLPTKLEVQCIIRLALGKQNLKALVQGQAGIPVLFWTLQGSSLYTHEVTIFTLVLLWVYFLYVVSFPRNLQYQTEMLSNWTSQT